MKKPSPAAAKVERNKGEVKGCGSASAPTFVAACTDSSEGESFEKLRVGRAEALIYHLTNDHSS